jgi:hypothetical protein
MSVSPWIEVASFPDPEAEDLGMPEGFIEEDFTDSLRTQDLVRGDLHIGTNELLLTDPHTLEYQEECALECASSFKSDDGRLVQVDPVKPSSKPPGIQHLKLIYDKPHSNYASQFNSRRYTMVSPIIAPATT